MNNGRVHLEVLTKNILYLAVTFYIYSSKNSHNPHKVLAGRSQ